jgi:hypothetical protein
VRWVPAVAIAALVGAAAWLWVSDRRGTDRVKAPPLDEGTAPVEPPKRPEPTTGTLRIRVRTEDGTPVPPGTRAGFLRPGGTPRMRLAGGDGTFLFTDAPVGLVDLVAEADGWRTARGQVSVVPGVDAGETVLTLQRPEEPPRKE